MLAVLSGGGTAGHINPALALAEELTRRGCEVRYAGTPQGVEARLVPAAGVEFKAFEAQGFDRSRPMTLPKALIKIARSTKKAQQWFDEVKPDVVVGFGGYVCLPVCRAARKARIPYLLHEQNSVMGLANKQLATGAERVCLTYEETSGIPDSAKLQVTGNPVRRQVVEATREEGRQMLGIPNEAPMLLVFGGSLGARHLNEAFCAMKDELLACKDLHVVHITGPKEFDAVQAALGLSDAEATRWHLMGYQNRMGETLAATDMIVSRAGATSLAEIAALGIPALLVPFPFATADHQTTNARAWVEAGCADIIADDEVDTPAFKEKVMRLITDAGLREDMRRAALAQKAANAAENLADTVLEVAKSARLR